MRIKINTVLFNGSKRCFERSQEFEITNSNLGEFIAGSLTIGQLPIIVSIKFRPEDYDPHTSILHGRAEMERPNCNAYKKDLIANGWTELTPETQVAN